MMTDWNSVEDLRLRKWCLERAFETREMSKVAHMEVTNVAEDYYRWIVFGESQGNMLGKAREGPSHIGPKLDQERLT